MHDLLCATCAQTLPPDVSTEGACLFCHGPILLDARYALESILGSGVMGMTYRARRLCDGERFAIKELAFRTLDTFKTQELFEREARVLGELHHPCVPALIEHFRWGIGKNRALYLVETLIPGQTLADEMKTHRYTEDEVLRVMGELLRVLRYLHELSPPVIHRDIKPDNIMRHEDGRLMLIDFGSVCDDLPHSMGSTVTGTFGYMAPEAFRGSAVRASDMYSLGVLAVHMLTRQPPHTMLDQDNHLVWASRVEVSAPTRQLLADLLCVDPQRRASNARRLRRRVKQIRRQLRDPQQRALVERAVEPVELNAAARVNASGELVRVAPGELAPREESLFGPFALVVMLWIPMMAALPCVYGMLGPQNTAILTLMGLLGMILLVPFMPRAAGDA